MRSYLILAMCGLYLVYYFVHQEWLQYLVVFMVLVAFVSCVSKAQGFPKWLGLFMMGTGIFLECFKGNGLQGLGQSLLMILPLLCLLVFAPLLAMPLRIGGYFHAVHSLLRNLLHHPKKLFTGITGILFILTPILNLGSVRILNEFLQDLRLPSTMSAKSYLVGFCTSPLWSPYFASVSLILYYLAIPVGEYILYGFCFALLSLLIGNLQFAIWVRRHPLVSDSVKEIPLEKTERNQLVRLVLFVLALLFCSLLIEYWTHWSMLVIVSLISLCFPVLWALTSKGWSRLIPPLKQFRDQTLPMLNNEIVLFTSAGLLGHSLQGTRIADGTSSYLTALAQQSFFLFALVLMALIIVVTYVGIHQIAVISALAMQLDAQQLGISNISLAMLLLLAWSTSTALSPFSGLNLMVSKIAGLSGVTSVRQSCRSNRNITNNWKQL